MNLVEPGFNQVSKRLQQGFGQEKEKENKTEKEKFVASLLPEMKRNYVKTLRNTLMEPSEFGKLCVEQSEDHAVLIHTHFSQFKEIFAAAKEI